MCVHVCACVCVHACMCMCMCIYSTSRRSLNVRLRAGRVWTIPPPTLGTRADLRSSASESASVRLRLHPREFVRVRLHVSMSVRVRTYKMHPIIHSAVTLCLFVFQ